MAPPTHRGEPIAIIGSGCRFPGESSSPTKLWDLLKNPRDVLSPIPNDRFNVDGFYHKDGTHHGATDIRDAYLLSEDNRQFDAQFFSIQPAEAESMDPQQRLLLETVYDSLDSAGLRIEDLKGSPTSVYVGLMCADYGDLIVNDFDSMPTYAATGMARSIISNRISYFFDWHGPSMTIDTACSSSLVAMHQAVQGLRNGESRVAVAAGANLILGPVPFIAESKLHMLSATGRSHMWDERADGYARGEGIASVVMKTLSAAIEDGDHIECIIRETGVNQDGRSKGITMPSQDAQADLIRATYDRAGLDVLNKNDRCQYFEAHGTGTPAGDPVEAEAVSRAFFGPDNKSSDDKDILYVGSIKTIVGHTEGTAGLAGVIKASLALQYSTIPPNMHFDKLSATVQPFYNNLEISKTAKPWPTLPFGVPRRASVNSFGFGGTNAHAILEAYDPEQHLTNGSLQSYKQTNSHVGGDIQVQAPLFSPFVFSASSEKALLAQLQNYSTYVQDNPFISLRDFAWTLQNRRSVLPFRAFFSAQSAASLSTAIDGKLQALKDGATTPSLAIRPVPGAARLLGVFTGQGAQWPSMGASLIRQSATVEATIDMLESSLAELPLSDRPAWSLKAELLAGAKKSRLSEAALAQPLCTAVQVVLVDLLKSAGVVFDAVVGHSSGEIGAAYAAGFITSYDAIRIAYYRGFHAKLARSESGEAGAMLAVGTSLEDAAEFCELSDFEGRVAVAACNSSSSVTLSGDSDAIQEALEVFEEEKKFVRMLKVDTAYHSHHMIPCAEPYMASLRACNIELLTPSKTTAWYSSLREGVQMQQTSDLLDSYWKDNMVSAVKFSQAIEAAVAGSGSFSAALEVGPHPALQGPALSTIADKQGAPIPYSGVLSRGKDDLESFANGLGFLWTQTSKALVDFNALEKFACPSVLPSKLLKQLPAYPFDHDRRFWCESRITRAFHGRSELPHEVLGVKSRSSTERHIQWHNTLKVKEIPWLRGHQLQGQIIFPAAGYICMALKASETLVPKDSTAKLLEIHDLFIHKAISFYDENSGVEVLFDFNHTPQNDTEEVRTADFTIYAALNKSSTEMTIMTTGRVEVTIAEPSPLALPAKEPPVPNMIETAVDRFYEHLKTIGYEYTLDFQGMSATKRKMNFASGLIARPVTTDEDKSFLIHPAVIDIAFQAVFLAYCAPNDGGLWSIHVPTHIQRISINPLLCQIENGKAVDLPFYSNLTDTTSAKILADINVYSEDSLHTVIQVEGMTAMPLAPATPADDFRIFAETLWKVANPDGDLIVTEADRATPSELEFAYTLERLAFFYLRTLCNAFTAEERDASAPHYQSLFNFAAHICSLVAEDKHPFAKKEWENDTHDQIISIAQSHSDNVDTKLMVAVGENLPAAVRGETDILSHMTKDDVLFRYYKEALGIPQSNEYISRMMKQISHRYPHTSILEIGGGTGGCTKSILEKLGKSYSSYTFTDISAGFFPNAQEQFKDQASKMLFKTLNIEGDIVAQGFTPASYDIIIASNVIHATESIEKSLKNARRLLKPGGYLLLLEITNNSVTRLGTYEGGLPGWWAGKEEGRILAPTITPAQWNEVLMKSGFAGIDTITPEHDIVVVPVSIMAAQAIDEKIMFIRDPFSCPDLMPKIKELIIVGGTTPRISAFTKDITSLLKPLCDNITVVNAVEEIHSLVLPPNYSVLSVTDLDVPVFRDFTAVKFECLKRIFDQASNVLWITAGCRADDPYANMSVGIGRSVRLEIPHVRFQYLDIEFGSKPEPQLIAETLMRLQVVNSWEQEGALDKMLWTVEPEMAYENGVLMIPRIYEEEVLNARFNSKRRPITEEIAPKTNPIELHQSEEGYELRSQQIKLTNQDLISIRVHHSLLSSIKIKYLGHAFIGLGTDVQTNEKVIFISDHNSSIVNVPRNHTTTSDIATGSEQTLLLLTAGHLLTNSILETTKEGSTIIVHQSEPVIKSLLKLRASEKNIKIVFTTDGETLSTEPQNMSIPTKASLHRIKSMLPAKPAAFLDFSVVGSNAGEVAGRIRACLPTFCKAKNSSTLFATESELLPGVQLDHINIALRISTEYAHQNLSSASSLVPLRAISPSEVQARDTGALNSILDWGARATLPVKVELADHVNLFSADKTYILVGLTAEIGNSLCEWMIRKGAKYLVLTSRNPKLSDEWLQMLKEMGAIITIKSLDVTNQTAVHAFIQNIKDTHPPIAGVANGAMILRDTMFANMDLDTMVSVLKPKVEGSQYLDECFPENTLDFFIMFGSLASILGNSGQSNYNAANMYMTSLAAQRRKRGLAASVMDLAGIIGVGYLSRAALFTHQLLIRAGTSFTSERDLHQTFAEAFLAGKSDSGRNPEIIAGLRRTDSNEHPPVPWYHNPRFSHFVVEEEIAKSTGDKKNTVPVKQELESATNLDEAYQVIKTCFFNKIQITLQLAPDVKISEQVPLSELGVDSLVAVDIRTWFQKELEVDMAVLKLLAGASIGELLHDALEKIPKIFMPNLELEKGAAVDEKPQTNIIQVDDTQASSSTSDAESSPIDLNFTLTPESSPSQTDETSKNLSDEEEDLYEEVREMEAEPEPVIPPTLLRAAKMSIPQATFWFLKHYLQDQTSFNITFSTCMSGELRIDDLEHAVRVVGEKHEILQTCFFAGEDGELMQGIMESPPFHLEQKDIEHEDDVKVEFEKIRTHVYDIERGETLRVMLLKLSPTTNYVIVGYPHIALDGHSFSIFFSEVQEVYNGNTLKPPMLKYTEFATNIRNAVEDGGMDAELSFWKSEFDTVPAPLPLFPFPNVTNRHPVTTYAQNLVDHRLDQALGLKIKDIARKNHATPFHFYLTTMKALLFRLLDTSDLCIGIADANRSEKDAMGVMGLFLNLLPLRFREIKKQSFAQAIKETRDKSYSALANDRLPFDTLVNELNIQRDVTYSPLFQAFFDYRQTTPEKQPFGNCTTDNDAWDFGRTSYDFNIDILENPAGDSVITLKTQAGLYSREDTEHLMKAYISLLQSFVGSSRVRLDDPTLFGVEEMKQVALLGEGDSMTSEWPATLVHRIDDMIKQHPDRIAIKDGNNTVLTYQALSERVNGISLALLKSGVEAGSRVVMFQEPSADFVCSMLAVLRINAVYVPLDLRNPISRLAVMVANCQAVAILAHDGTMYDCPKLSSTAATINVTGLSSVDITPILATPESPAMILYTSGSTGEPKGIVLVHSGLSNEIEGFTREYGVKAETILQQSAVSVDICNAQVLTALTLGGTLYVVPKEKRGDPLELCNLILKEKITYTKATSSEYSVWIRYGKDILSQCQQWKTAWSAGESLSSSQALEFRTLALKKLRLFNSYGPAEISMSCTKVEIPYWVKDDLIISAGRSIPNYSIYVVDKALKRLPAGVVGEICVGGPGVAKEYLHLPELTKAKFIPNTFATPEQKARGWTRMYRTGDRGYLALNGNLLFKGRMSEDSQVKLRGLRIELGDIESTIVRTGNGTIAEAVASVVGEPPFIVAHVVLSAEVKDVQAYMRDLLTKLELPQYMIPALLVSLERLPLTPQSKIDRRAIQALPLPSATPQSKKHVELTSIEIQVANLWAKVIPEEIFGGIMLEADTDFFKVGGNSLLLVKLQSTIRERFNIVLPLVKLYECSTLSKLAAVIKDSSILQPIIWSDEVRLKMSHIRGTELTHPRPLSSQNKIVLLTGATGYLGKHILAQLVSDNSISEIHCIAIRRKEGQGLEESRIHNASDKIIEYSGDLSSRRLGLSPEDFQALAESVDLIIHSGANRAFWEDYRVLRKTNLSSTMELVNLSARRKIPIHFLSSGGVLLLGDQPQVHPISVAQNSPPEDGSNGYVASKWAGEVYLHNAARRLGIPVCIHRTTSSPSDAVIPHGMLDDIVRLSTKIEAFPILDDWQGSLDLMSVSSMAKDLLAVSFHMEEADAGQPKFVHHASNVKISSGNIGKVLSPYIQLGMFETISLLKWIGKLKEAGFGYFVASQDAMMTSGGDRAFVSRR
ncbi:related to polyketide synthase [Rhynchosporium agropyri]|uniref:Related to polyketide synthase n=1 Tax=Rhynchosporium agropyri TaxID=914238 RepID=A0A1E1KWD8_9HELO|nr:related to polyketide synthase [Rhynchosporium agropyri]